ncbi:MAG: type III pantothenate kinase [Dehalococcoidales bacterium]|jgi:type III pantothenate kinase|nr:type III pantothenate kinase [Dehalococcoidales bacterium]MDD3265237.1 type III pantothenate kinase [Dehalococcoidales bacterium]MDD4322203.1 type III pantothenate kinase [Dehalococcoidales bacterium]MDD5122198.1 type III pantothenate kinase [Dehalococcoidales bacterium]MDD5498714.1 type III pantothenate kinase [Dehalococcoidales bacterium]
MLLVIDIGNTETNWGVFEGEILKARWSSATVINRTVDEYRILLNHLLADRSINPGQIKNAVMCSVVPPLTGIFEEMLLQATGTQPLIVGAGVKTGIRIRMDNPREVGADRIVNAVAAHSLYSGAVIVIDMGTTTTFDVISPEGDYLGGAIAPGLKTGIEALYSRTAVLPRVELSKPERAIGTNTAAAMRSGLVYGHAAMVEGLVSRIKNELKHDVTVVATGGLSPVIEQETTSIDIINTDLTLTGLKLIYKLNRD